MPRGIPNSTREGLEEEAKAPEDKTFEYDGETYSIDLKAMDDVEVLEAFEDNKIVSVVRTVVGPVQWVKFKSKKRNADDLSNFAELVFGVESGK